MKNKKLLQGQTAFITGASRGIGAATAELFASEGAHLLLHCRKFGKDEKALATKLKRKFGVKVEFFEADFNELEDMLRMWKEIKKQFKHIDILVNNAGLYPDKKFFTSDEQSWDKVMNINLKTPYFLTQKVAALMKKKGWLNNQYCFGCGCLS